MSKGGRGGEEGEIQGKNSKCKIRNSKRVAKLRLRLLNFAFLTLN
jgi:hypothetical protein